MSSDRWVDQTIFAKPGDDIEKCTGNCVQASLASLFGIKLEDVPSFQGLDSSDFWEAVDEFILTRGYVLWLMDVVDRGSIPAPDCYYIVSGRTVREGSHAVVYKDGKLAHDPHHSRAGLTSVTAVWVLVPIDPSKLRLEN